MSHWPEQWAWLGNMMTLGGDLVPIDSYGEFLRIWRLIGDADNTGATLLIDSVDQMLTSGAMALLVTIFGFLSVLIFLFTVPETHRRDSLKDLVSK